MDTDLAVLPLRRDVPPGAIVVTPGAGDQTQAIQTALDQARDAGGGTVYLAPGRYLLSEPLRLGTDVAPDDRQAIAFHVRLLGAAPVEGHDAAATTLVWVGADAAAAVLDVSHSRNVTIENLRIEAAAGRRFRYGVLFHRTDSAQSGRARFIAPSALNVLSCGVGPGAGSFTCGVRLGDPGPGGDLDQNCDHVRLERLFIDGASDEPGGTTSAFREGRTGAGVLIGASQVQGSFFCGLSIQRCPVGVFVLDGQLALFSSSFADNGGAGQGPAGRGGGDVVLRTGLRAGHLVQDTMSRGSLHFLTSFLEDQDSQPPTGTSAAWQGDAIVATTLLRCQVSGARDPGGAVELLGNGGPLVLFDCRLGAPQDPPHQVRVGGFTQGTITLARCRFNHHLAPVVVQDDGPTPGARPTVELLGCPGFADTGPALPADTPDWMPAPRLRPSLRAAAATRIPSPATENEDSSETLQAALDALAQRGGGVLLLPPGLFVLRRPLQLPSHVALQGVGGRGGATVVGPGQTRGTLLSWAGDAEGPMLRLEDCTGARVSGLHFTTAGAPGGDPGPTTVRTMIAVRGGTDLWLEDLGAGWLAGDGGGAGAGVCETFLRIDGGASAVTLRGAGLQQVAGQGVDVEQARDIEFAKGKLGYRRKESVRPFPQRT